MSDQTITLKLTAPDSGSISATAGAVNQLSKEFIALEWAMSSSSATMRQLNSAHEAAQQAFETGNISLQRYQKSLAQLQRDMKPMELDVTIKETRVTTTTNASNTDGPKLPSLKQISAVGKGYADLEEQAGKSKAALRQARTDYAKSTSMAGKAVAVLRGGLKALPVVGNILSLVEAASALGEAFDSSKSAAERMETALGKLNTIVNTSFNGTTQLTGRIMALAQESEAAANLEITVAANLSTEAYDAGVQKLKEHVKGNSSLFSGLMSAKSIATKVEGANGSYTKAMELISAQEKLNKLKREADQKSDVRVPTLETHLIQENTNVDNKHSLRSLEKNYGLKEPQAIELLDAMVKADLDPTVKNLESFREVLSNVAEESKNPTFQGIARDINEVTAAIIRNAKVRDSLKGQTIETFNLENEAKLFLPKPTKATETLDATRDRYQKYIDTHPEAPSSTIEALSGAIGGINQQLKQVYAAADKAQEIIDNKGLISGRSVEETQRVLIEAFNIKGIPEQYKNTISSALDVIEKDISNRSSALNIADRILPVDIFQQRINEYDKQLEIINKGLASPSIKKEEKSRLTIAQETIKDKKIQTKDDKSQVEEAQEAASAFLKDGSILDGSTLEKTRELLRDTLNIKGLTHEMATDFNNALEGINQSLSTYDLAKQFMGPEPSEIDRLINIQNQFKEARDKDNTPEEMKEGYTKAIDNIEGRIDGIKFDNMTNALSTGFSSMQSMFDEGSKGYQAMEVAIAAVSAAQAISAVLNQASGDPYTAFARMAAMAAAVAKLGVSISGLGGGGSDPTAKRQATQGTGTVLGDPTAKSDTIENSNQQIAEATETLVDLNRGMLDSLNSLSTTLKSASQYISGNINYTKYISDNTENKYIGIPNVETLPRVLDEGIVLSIGGQNTDTDTNSYIYQDRHTEIRYMPDSPDDRDTSYEREMFEVAAPNNLESYFDNAIDNIFETIEEAASALHYDPDKVKSVLDKPGIDPQSISLEGLNPEEVADEINHVFSTVTDTLATKVAPDLLKNFQELEGPGQTLVRVAAIVSASEKVIKALGLTFGEAEDKLKAHTNLVKAFDSLEDFLSSYSEFSEAFLSKQQQFENKQAQLQSAFAKEGAVLPESREAFLALVQAQDAATESGAKNIVKLLNISEAADEYYSTLEEQESTRSSLQQRIYELEGNSAEALKITRQQELDGLDESNKVLQSRIYLLEDEANRESTRSNLQQRIYELEGKSAEALKITRQKELDALDESNKALQNRIYLIEDEQKLKEQTKSDVNDAFGLLERSIDKQIETLTNNWDITKEKLETDISNSKEQIANLDAFAKAVKSVEEQFNPTTQLDFIKAQQEALNWSKQLQDGNRDITKDPDGYQKTLKELGSLDKAWYSNATDYERDKQITTNALNEANAFAKDQKTLEEELLETAIDDLKTGQKDYDLAVKALNDEKAFWQTEIDAINGVDGSVTGVATAIDELKTAISKAWEEGAGASGVSNDDITTWVDKFGDTLKTASDVQAAMNEAGITGAQVGVALGLIPQDSNVATDEMIQTWMDANPTASDADFGALMRIWGVSIERIAKLTGVSVGEVESRYRDIVPDLVIDHLSLPTDGGHSDREVRDWLNQHGDATYSEVAEAMKANGYTIEQMAKVLGWRTQDVEAAYLGIADSEGRSTDEAYVDGRHLLKDQQESIRQASRPAPPRSTPDPVQTIVYPRNAGHTDAEVDAWLKQNSGASDEQIAAAMLANGVTIEQMAKVTQTSAAEIRRRYNAAINGSHADGLESVPFDGYVAQLHKGEMVLPSGQSDYLRSGETAKQFKSLADQIESLRSENKALLQQIAKSTKDNAQTTRVISRGQPVYVVGQTNESNTTL